MQAKKCRFLGTFLYFFLFSYGLEEKLRIYWNKESNSKNLIGQRVKELRTERQLSQKALAEQLQLAGYEFSDLTVLRIEQGTRFVPDYEVVALAEFFHVSCEYLLGVRSEK
ncbi:helix-turn-helix transcriptional regulator [Velocimicrobium porci]